LREQRYWDVWDHTEPLVGVSEGEIASRLLSELRTAMSLTRERRAKQVWYMLNFALWGKHYIASEPLDLPEGLAEEAPVGGVLDGAA
jgi:hypothetical protein